MINNVLYKLFVFSPSLVVVMEFPPRRLVIRLKFSPFSRFHFVKSPIVSCPFK